jgi:hypothetical protein
MPTIFKPTKGAALLAACFALLSAGCANISKSGDAEARIWRAVLVGQQSGAPIAKVIDIGEDELVKEFKLDSISSLRPGSQPHELLLISREPGAVRLLHTGMREEDHGDHKHWMAKEPQLSAPLATGMRPSHANVGAGRIAAFFDGEGMARVFAPAAAAKDGKPPAAPAIVPAALNSGKPHHGIAVPLEQGRLLLSRPAPEGTLPLGVNLVDAAGKIITAGPDCPRQHGDAAYQSMHFFGCAAHVVVYSETQNNFRVVNYPAGTPPEQLVRNILASPAQPQLFADFGPNAMATLDARDMGLKPIALPAKRLHFAWDGAAPRFGFVLTDDGQLHRIDTHTAKIEQSTPIMPAWTEALGVKKDMPAPRIAVASDRIIVTDARQQHLQVFNTQAFKLLDTLKLGMEVGSAAMVSVVIDGH